MSSGSPAGAQPADENAVDHEEPTGSELREEVEELREVAETASATARRAQSRVLDFREEIEDQREEIETLREEKQELEQELKQLRDRTGLLEHVQEASALKPEKRAAILIQTLYNKAHARKTSDANNKPTASMDYNAAEAALGGNINRDAIYRTFERAEDLVDDDGLVRYVKESRGASKNTRLVLDLREGDVPSTIGGRNIASPEEVK